MNPQFVYPTQVDTQNLGGLKVSLTASSEMRPIENAVIRIASPSDPDNVLEEVRTDISGQTSILELPAPSRDYSEEPDASQPYSEYNISVEAPGYEQVVVSGTQILPGEVAIQPVALNPSDELAEEAIAIPPHTLYGEYSPKIAESEIKPVQESGEIVLSQVVIPETIVVHAGPPTDRNAKDYYVPYRDYVKNVASSEIYATWPESTILANILAIMSFSLNRVYTEWYRGRGYNFTITSSTAFDQFYVHGRNIYENISALVDTVFTNYLARPNVRQPILTQYCDGRSVTCPNWMSQWGSKALGDQGYTAIEIVRNYYGNTMYIETAQQVSGIPSSWPGSDLTIGSRGPKVLQLQEQLNRIARNYPALPTIGEDGIYGEQTANSVRTFQKIFDLPQTGVTDFATWYKVSAIYVAVSRIAELM